MTKLYLSRNLFKNALVRFLKIVAVVFIFLLSHFSLAQEVYRRSISFDWDQIEDAQGYDIEISKMNQGQAEKSFSFKVQKNSWSGKLAPGHYVFRVRSKDYRQVPGDWSELRPFDVNLGSVKIKSPQPQSIIKAKSDNIEKISFEWAPVGGADSYSFDLTSEDKSFSVKQKVNANKLEIDVPVAQKFQWTIKAESGTDLSSDNIVQSDFQVIGKKLNHPALDLPENEFVRKISWKKIDNSQSYEVVFSNYNSSQKKWIKFKTLDSYKKESIDFDNTWPGGRWKIFVKAKAPMRIDSDYAQMSFPVFKGDRSPASEYVATVRKSIDRMNGWFATASWLTTFIKYDNPVRSIDNAIGGTGRLGLGWLAEKQPLGFMGIVDYSGFLSDGYNHTYASLELLAIYRRPIRDTDELRVNSGLFYKEIPVLQTYQDAAISGDQLSRSKISGYGPVVGLEYWHSLSPKLGIQVNSYVYYAPFKDHLPTNASGYQTSTSYQLGALSSYRINPKLTGLVGLTYREDRLSYTDSFAETNLTTQSPTVTTAIKGFYLSLFAEYSF